jgi:hypothetical protein
MHMHTYRGKRSLGWRTMLVVPELENEVNMWLSQSARYKRIEELRELRDELDEWVDRLSLLLVSCDNDRECKFTDRREQMLEELAKAREELEVCVCVCVCVCVDV